ncbi:transcription initiation factor IIB-like [Artemia franciscana]|uniref:transcription initiation factor IIB-like n=1 Tax=Artemia franciscana TaxID=6661 RepID=UPI0032DBF19E
MDKLIQSNNVNCPYHPQAYLIEDSHAGDSLCSECALVVGERTIDVGSEWRSFSNEKSSAGPSRVGGPENLLFEGRGLSTMIGPAGSGSFGKLDYAKYNISQMSSSDRALKTALKSLEEMADKLHLPSTIVDEAGSLFKRFHGGKSLKGRSNNAIASACLFIAFRQEGNPRTFKELCAVSSVSVKEIKREFKLILSNLSITLNLITPGDFIARFCNNLGLPYSVQRSAHHIAEKAMELDIVPGRSPISVAAAAIYMASQASENRCSQKDIGEVAGTAEATIRQAYRLMLPSASLLFPADFKFAIPIKDLPQS